MASFCIKKKEGTRRRVVWSLFIVFPVLPERNSVGASFAGALNAWFLHQIEQNLHEKDPLQFFYNPMW
jgi:hypothetical protein